MVVSGRRFHFPRRGANIKEDFFFHCAKAPSGPGASRSHSDTPYSVGLLSPTQRPLLENTQRSGETDVHDPGGIRTSNPSKRTVANSRLGARLLGFARGMLREQCNWGLGAEDSVACLVLMNTLTFRYRASSV